MAEHLKPPSTPPTANNAAGEDANALRMLSRSPHPYHRQNFELLEPSDRLIYRANAAAPTTDQISPSTSATTGSDSGTEADDEHFLKGLPAPKARLHKGLRGRNETFSGASTPLLSSGVFEENEGRRAPLKIDRDAFVQDKGKPAAERTRRRKEVLRRTVEVLLLVFQGGLLASNREVRPLLRLYRKELVSIGCVFSSLVVAYPLRLVVWAYRQGKPSRPIPISIPTSFDPAPLLYPPLIPLSVSFLVAQNVRGVVLPNLVLSICALPKSLIPATHYLHCYSSVHWALSCIPLYLTGSALVHDQGLPQETLVLLYPLHQTLCLILHYLTTTSLLSAELQLLSVALINVLLLAQSPQAVILKGVLWGGGLGLIIACSHVIKWGIDLARVPKWRFKRVPTPCKGTWTFRMLRQLWSPRQRRRESFTDFDDSSSETGSSSDEERDARKFPSKRKMRASSMSQTTPATLSPATPSDVRFMPISTPKSSRTSPLSALRRLRNRSASCTPSGRRKRATSSSVRAFFSLTQAQATMRKWMYAGYAYLCIVTTILVGIREYVKRYALSDREPIGWALGYLFGDIPWFRFQVVKANLESWICLPPRSEDVHTAESCYMGWVQHVRHASLGAANTRLFLSAYWLAIIITGLAIVFRLSPIYEVDTRRKVFHFMMVGMFLPAIFIDPTYVALALSLMLAIFLVLDLLRASQLPPLSKPIASFLTPYVDGRDLRGPVVISHIFLLIGCAIPLWLSLAALPRTRTDDALDRWEVPTRDISMVSGVVCVGLGDAAASLIGRRWGHHKWFWGGGKSLEGSVAFAAAVFAGLMAASVWLRIGGWPWPLLTPNEVEVGGLNNILGLFRQWSVWSRTAQKTAICASMASLTEAVLTGGNDNVVVPVVVWTCVKSMGL